MDGGVSAVSAVSRDEVTGLAGFADNLVDALRAEETKIRETFVEGLRPDGDLMKVPDHMSEQFRKWEQAFTAPEDLALVANVKRKVIEMNQMNADYMRDSVERKSEKVRLELAMKAVSKTTQGIQQLLSSQ